MNPSARASAPANRFAHLAASAGLAMLAGPGLLAATAGAQSYEDARAAYLEGRFLDAAAHGEALGTSEGYALAARSLAIYAHYVATDEERKAVIDQAIRVGEEAVLADSTNPEAFYQAAHAYGRFAQHNGKVAVLRKGTMGKIRDLLEAAIALEPGFAEAILALGGWHADVHDAGRMARWMYGGDREKAVELFERALEMMPDSRVALYEYAVRLPKLDKDGGGERAGRLLAKASELHVADAYDGFIQELVLAELAAREGR
ncbi:MAG: hypothetical protein OXQ94_09600 [Gemmatimonadota bacterium]|nr:hypothetical protein [Gemmatimonadota bacterium]MDE2871924.1 hypothetical protein [Gemmatimonadota bacterium]